MDSIFSPKPHTLSLISCSPISSSLIPRRHQCLFGSSHNNLRPPGFLRSRRKCRNIGFQFGAHSSRFVLRASVDSQSVMVVAAVVTISALTIIFFEFSKRNANIKEEEKSVETPMKEVCKVSNEREDGGTDVQLGGDYLMQTVITNKIESADANQMASISGGSLTLGAPGSNTHAESDVVPSSYVAESHNNYLQEHLQGTKTSNSLTAEVVSSEHSVGLFPAINIDKGIEETKKTDHALMAHAESDVVPSSYVAESHNNYLQEHLQGTKTSNRLTAEVVSSEHSVGLCPAINIDKGIEETKKTDHALMADGRLNIDHKHVAEDEVSIHNLIFRDSARKELYSFFEASTKNLNGQKALTSHASGERISVFSHTSKVSSIQAEDFKEKRPHGCYKEGPFNNKDFGKRKHHFTKKEKSILLDKGTTKQFQIPNPKRIQVCDGPQPSDQFRAYRYFLREGRLMDCIEMLDNMERRGSLNMDKVYHAGFFQACKSQKAVKEAFRFTKLIQNPTLSTFNMLLSVCASSRDLEGAFRVLQLVRETGLKPDCKLYTTLISTCAKSGKVDTMFEL